MLQQVLERMRRAREEQGLDIEALSKKTRIRAHQLEAVEQGRFDELPRGVYARAVVRAYASAVGMEPNNAVAQIAPLLPEPEDPMTGIARVHGYDPPARPAPSVSRAEPHPERAATAPDVAHADEPAGGWWPVTPDLVPRLYASVIDGAILASIAAVLVALSARAAGLGIADLLAYAAPAMVMLAVLIAGLYFLLLGGVAGATIGERLARLAPAPGEAPPVDLRAVCRRGGRAAARELSIVVDLVVPLVAAWRSAGTRAVVRSDTQWEGKAPVL